MRSGWARKASTRPSCDPYTTACGLATVNGAGTSAVGNPTISIPERAASTSLNTAPISAGGLTFKLAKEFGFCYGVDRAVEYAYQVETKFPDKRVFLVGEIIHNPHVNAKLEAMGITVLCTGSDGRFDFAELNDDDVVIIPAFGVTVKDLERLRGIGCVLVDTTCGSVLNVWKRVEKYAKEGFTALIHGKHFHEESKATASQVTRYPGGKYLIVRNMDEALIVCRFIEEGGDGASIEKRFEHAMSPGLSQAPTITTITRSDLKCLRKDQLRIVPTGRGTTMERDDGSKF